ncbi:cytochrome b [Aureimonas ureilytica]|uniref:cytochrome b n=1 Tax=Aureimonas ureilytica TaxID=401562 RepID=UPI003CE76032
MSTRNRWADSPQGYGLVSRTLHWTMALLISWQLVTAVVRAIAEHGALDAVLWGTHTSVGFTIWWLAILRGIWGFANLSRRPPHEGHPLMRRAATLGHAALYALLILEPTLRMLRAFFKGRDLVIYGIPLLVRGEARDAALGSLVGEAHEFLGWSLFVLIAGHIAVALWHHFVRRDGTLRGMTHGSTAPRLRAGV